MDIFGHFNVDMIHVLSSNIGGIPSNFNPNKYTDPRALHLIQPPVKSSDINGLCPATCLFPVEQGPVFALDKLVG